MCCTRKPRAQSSKAPLKGETLLAFTTSKGRIHRFQNNTGLVLSTVSGIVDRVGRKPLGDEEDPVGGPCATACLIK
jgi:hypothetical protein